MGGSIARGLIERGGTAPADLTVAEIDADRRSALAAEFGVESHWQMRMPPCPAQGS